MKSLKLITTIITLFVSVFVYANTNVQKPDVKASAEQPKENKTPMKIIYGPYVHGVSETEATVVWVTNKPAISWVEIAPKDKTSFYAKQRPRYFNAPLGRKLIDTFHTIKIKNLQPNTKYRYRVVSRCVVDDDVRTHYGETVGTRVFRKVLPEFKTLDTSKKEITFSVVNDIHEKSNEMSNLLKFVPKNSEFLMLNGDMVHSMRTQDQMFKSFLNVAGDFSNKGIPMFMIRGNHEARGTVECDFMKYFPTPTNKPYFTFRAGHVMFVVIDGGEDKPDNDIEYSDRADFDTYRKDQAQWLKDVINSKEYKDAPVKILVTHIPPSWGGWHGSIHFQKMFAEIINNAGFSLIISGHLHKHVFAPTSDSVKVPNIINSNCVLMNVHVDSEKITMKFLDSEGKKTTDDIVVDVKK